MAKKSPTKSNDTGRSTAPTIPVETPRIAPEAVKAAATTTAKPGPARASSPAPVKAAPTREQIAKRAYEIYLARGQSPGHENEDWAQAERELKTAAHVNN